MNSSTDRVPQDEIARQARREVETLQEMARAAQGMTERRDREAAALRDREAAQLAGREAEAYRQAAEIERRLEEFRRVKDREAEDARRETQQRETAARVRAQEGEVADAGSRYAQALGQHYDISDPYHSLARAAMAEYGAFHREQDRLRREIAQEPNADKRQLLELRKEIEAADYMAITSARLAGIGRVVAGRDDTEQVQRDEARAQEFADRSRELRENYRELLAQRLTRGNGEPDRQPGGDGPQVIAGVVRDPRRDRQQRQADAERRARDGSKGTQAAAPDDGSDASKPSPAALARIRKQRDRYEALETKREQAKQQGRTPGGGRSR